MEKKGVEEGDVKKEKKSYFQENYCKNRRKRKPWHSQGHDVFNT